MEDFDPLSAKDRQDVSYVACIGGTTLVGAAVGRFGGLPGLVGGAAVGLAIGLLTCKRLAPAIEKKIFSSSERLTEGEVLSAIRVIRDQTGVRSKTEARYLLSQVRAAAAASGESIRSNRTPAFHQGRRLFNCSRGGRRRRTLVLPPHHPRT
jgi:hypothetical protein